MVGTVVGTGIYLKPALLTRFVNKPWQALFLWALGGLFTSCGAMVYARLARNWPQSGGAYLYLAKSYGSWPASLLLAADIFLARPAAVGALATGFGLIWGLESGLGLLLALLLVTCLTLVQLMGSKVQANSQTFLTLLQLSPLCAILGTAVCLPSDSAVVHSFKQGEISWAAAFLAVLWAYDGWYNLTNLGGEVENPQTTIPFALVGGMLGVTTLYVLLNWILYRYVSVEAIETSTVPFVLLFHLWNLEWLGTALQFSLSFALLATLQGTLACGSRMIVAAVKDGLLREVIGEEPTATRPTMCFFLWCIGFLALFGGLPLELNLFDSLTELTGVIVALLSALTVTCVFRGSNFLEPVSVWVKACAVLYLGMSSVLFCLLVLEANVLAVIGAGSVLLLGTLLWRLRD